MIAQEGATLNVGEFDILDLVVDVSKRTRAGITRDSSSQNEVVNLNSDRSIMINEWGRVELYSLCYIMITPIPNTKVDSLDFAKFGIAI